MLNIVIFLNFLSFIYIVVGVDINYPTPLTKKLYITFFISFILSTFINVISYSDPITDYASNFLEVICILCIAFLFYLLKKEKILNKRSDSMFLLFLSTQLIIIINKLYNLIVLWKNISTRWKGLLRCVYGHDLKAL